MIGAPVGRVLATSGAFIEALIPGARVGDGARVGAVAARIVAVSGARATLTPFGVLDGLASGDRVERDTTATTLVLGTPLLGRAVDARGVPLDGRAAPRGARANIDSEPALPGQRAAVREIFWTGVRALDGPLAFGRGARIGIFGAPGCGKSTLLDAVAGGSCADAVVVGLVGERGREAERRLASLDARTTVVCATSDRSAGERVRAAEVAVAQARALQQRGLDVLLVLDSLARVAAAAREVALAAGEPPGRGGYPPSVFALLARLVEHAGAFTTGSITLVATVLSDGADEREPVSDAVRAALDGHITLSPELAARGWFPAIDLPRSTSRTFADVADAKHREAAGVLRRAVAALEETREARLYGLLPSGPGLARALAAEGEIRRFLCQDTRWNQPRATLTELTRLADMLEDGHPR